MSFYVSVCSCHPRIKCQANADAPVAGAVVNAAEEILGNGQAFGIELVNSNMVPPVQAWLCNYCLI